MEVSSQLDVELLRKILDAVKKGLNEYVVSGSGEKVAQIKRDRRGVKDLVEPFGVDKGVRGCEGVAPLNKR
jgi:hypothetical protein